MRDRVEFHWFHVPVGGSLTLGILSPEPLWYVGHYHAGRMRPCTGTGCELCGLKIGRQIRYVISCLELGTGRVGILEVGQGAGFQLRDRALARGSLRGVVLFVSRSGRSKHCRLDLEISDERPPGEVMMTDPLPLKEVLAATWAKQSR